MTRKARWLWIPPACLVVVALSCGAAGAADKTKVDRATRQVEQGAKQIGRGHVGPGFKEMADIGFGRGPAEADPDRRSDEIGSNSHRLEHMARANLARRAGGSGADHDAVEIEGDDLSLGGDPRHRDCRSVRQPRHRGTENHRVGCYGGDTRFQAVAQLADPVVNRDLLCRGRGSTSETGDSR